MKKHKWKVGDKFVDMDFRVGGIATITEIVNEGLLRCEWENLGPGGRDLHDEALIPLEVWQSPLWKALEEFNE